MVFAMTADVAAFVLGGASWASGGAGDAPMRVGNAPFLPQDLPQDLSTLTLALIGVGTIAIYFAAIWRPRRDVCTATPEVHDLAEGDEVTSDITETQSRDAA